MSASSVADLDTVSAVSVALGLEVESRTFLDGDFPDTHGGRILPRCGPLLE